LTFRKYHNFKIQFVH